MHSHHTLYNSNTVQILKYVHCSEVTAYDLLDLCGTLVVVFEGVVGKPEEEQ